METQRTTLCAGGRGLHDWQWLTPGDADCSYERQSPSSAGSARVQPDASSGGNAANTTSRLWVIRSLLAKSWTYLWGLNGRAGIMISLGRAEAASTAWRAEAPAHRAVFPQLELRVFTADVKEWSLSVCASGSFRRCFIGLPHSISSVMSTRWR